jgi:hypothetical protein
MLSFLMALMTVATGSAMAIEEPAYTVVQSNSDYEIRNYSKVLVAETKIEGGFEDSGNRAFRILADYIFGNNRSKRKISSSGPVAQEKAPVGGEKIAMTAPVGMERSGSGFLVQFTLPSSLTLETAPEPVDSRVTLREIPPRKLAVYRYSGSWSEDRFQAKLSEFLELLKRDGITAGGQPHFARFNSPFMIWFLRRNEIWIEVR